MVGGMFELTTKYGGQFRKTTQKLEQLRSARLFQSLSKFGAEGVAALASATPVNSGLTANSWTYEVKIERGSASVTWHNTNVVAGAPLAILLQYGHGTGTGGWVEGRDYINPVILPLFERIKADIRKAVQTA